MYEWRIVSGKFSCISKLFIFKFCVYAFKVKTLKILFWYILYRQLFVRLRIQKKIWITFQYFVASFFIFSLFFFLPVPIIIHLPLQGFSSSTCLNIITTISSCLVFFHFDLSAYLKHFTPALPRHTFFPFFSKKNLNMLFIFLKLYLLCNMQSKPICIYFTYKPDLFNRWFPIVLPPALSLMLTSHSVDILSCPT